MATRDWSPRALDYRTLPAQRVAGANWARADLNRLPGAPRGQATWRAVHDPMPRARVVNQVIESDEPRVAIHTVDPVSTAVVAPGEGLSSALTSAVTGVTVKSLRLKHDEPGHIRIEVDVPSKSFLVLTESYHRGWAVDGNVEGDAANNTTRTNGDFLGCLIDPGPRTVTFRFAPESLAWGRAVSILGLGLLVSLFGFAGRNFARRS